MCPWHLYAPLTHVHGVYIGCNRVAQPKFGHWYKMYGVVETSKWSKLGWVTYSMCMSTLFIYAFFSFLFSFFSYPAIFQPSLYIYTRCRLSTDGIKCTEGVEIRQVYSISYGIFSLPLPTILLLLV